ncbi:unnamed protein product [Coffea canephora]|uniref:Uncharacterized protein n=1 Tax=Coffea canephora TaxID=49390 RepID=A0A068UXZ2_COFCA|nr:unnamed protein product [Coffea canephora]
MMFLLDKFPKIRANELLASQKFELTIRAAHEPEFELQLTSLIDSSSNLTFFSRVKLELNSLGLSSPNSNSSPSIFKSSSGR